MTEREIIKRERIAYASALQLRGIGVATSYLMAEQQYPFPKEFREVWTRDKKRCYRYVNGELQCKSIWRDQWQLSDMTNQTFIELRVKGMTMEAVANIYETIADVMRQPLVGPE